ncbi:hypothetical protein [Streptomyces sp. NPDC006668]|uniref:hypothetical protein n=1 Tax=Streptomyces sp. NPDC006668 TaxID=3156903 RepID=UPI0033D95713
MLAGITAVAFHPGVVNSNIGTGAAGITNLIYNTRLGRATMISNDKGAAPLVHLATLPDPHSVNGQYFNKMQANSRTSKQARDGDFGRKLWDHTESLLGASFSGTRGAGSA